MVRAGEGLRAGTGEREERWAGREAHESAERGALEVVRAVVGGWRWVGRRRSRERSRPVRNA